MNLVIFDDQDYCADNQICLTGRRHQHITDIHNAQVGSSLRIGKLNGLIGTGKVISIDQAQVTLHVSLTEPTPEKLPLALILALPRPKMLKRILQTVSAMGVSDLYVINSYRVDKSYWSTPLLHENAIKEQLLLGLEQSIDTQLPTVHLKKRFKPFVEDELPGLSKNTRGLIAHPYNALPCPSAEKCATTLAIGPEGGFIPYEVEKLTAAGLSAFHIGPRILRVETAIPAIVSRLFPIF